MASKLTKTKQAEIWSGAFGREYTERNTFPTTDEYSQLYLRRYGSRHEDLSREWLKSIPLEARILEVGANVGYQLDALRRIGYRNLYGIEIQRYCVEKAKALHPKVDIIQAQAADLPFKSGYFDLVFTSGVLIHIAPEDLHGVQKEMHRVSGRWIFGTEYYSPELIEVPYRGHDGLLWKGNYADLFKSRFDDLRSVREGLFEYLDDPGKVDQFYLLEKQS